MSDEIKYCKFCNKEKPIKEFVKSGFAIKNICRECQNKKQAQIYRDSKKVKELEKENQELRIQASSREEVANKYKEVIDKAIEYLKKWGNEPDADMCQRINEYKEYSELLDILKEVE